MPRPRPIPPSNLPESAKRFFEDLLDYVESRDVSNVVGGRLVENGKDGRTIHVVAKATGGTVAATGCKSVWG